MSDTAIKAPSRWTRLKTWAADPDNQITAFTTTAYALVIGGTGWLIYAVAKEESRIDKANRQALADAINHEHEIVEWGADEWNKGNNVYQIAADQYLVVPRTGDQQIVIK